MLQNRYLVAIFCAVTAALVWGSSFIALKVAIAKMHPMSIIFLRMFIGSVVFAFFYKKFIRLKFDKTDIKYLILLVLFEPGFYYIFELKALTYTSASQAGIITSTMPLITAIAAGFLLNEKITKTLLFGLLLTIVGTIWLSLSAEVEEYAPNPNLGNFLEALAMVCGAGYAICIKKLSNRFPAFFLTAVQSFGGVIFYLPLFIFEWQNSGLSIDMESFLAILYLGIIVTFGGYGLFNYALSKAPASIISSFLNFIPVFTVILAYLILNERLNSTQILASCIVFLGVYISQKSKPKKKKT